jgi:pantoate--beta-alanine ligase
MKVIHDEPLERARVRRAFVPTMGALHDGHRALMREARNLVGPRGEVVVSIFVNPTQFAAGEDFDSYPRDLARDVRVCDEEGVDVVYAPSAQGVYGSEQGSRITIDPGPLGQLWEGAHRPGHFAGVLTVVSILLHQVDPNVAVFGEKDYQQLELVRRMCRDLSYGVEIVGMPTVREVDGLALSSRNVNLDPDQRRLASAVPRALEAAQQAATGGAEAALAAVDTVLAEARLVADYRALCASDLGPTPERGTARLLVAVPVGRTRLIDNCTVDLGGDDVR